MKTSLNDNLEKELSVLGKSAHLSLTQRQKIRDRLFKQIGQLDLIDSMQTKTESMDLVMPLTKLQNIFRPKKIMLGLPATMGLIATVFVATFTTGAIAGDATPGEPLFGVRKAFETVQVMLTRDPVRKASLQLSIADERLASLNNVTPEKLEAVLQESKKAIATAQTSVDALKEADETSAESLVSKLKSIVDNQKSILGTIVKDNLDNEEIKESVVAIRDELDQLIPVTKPVGEESVTQDGYTTLYGTMGSYAAKPVLLVDGKRYYLVGSDINLIPYMGLGGAAAFGRLEGDTLYLSKLLIEDRVIWDINLKNNLVVNTISFPGRG